MPLTQEDIIMVQDYFNNDALARCFICLYRYQQSKVHSTIIQQQGTIIGLKCPNEKFRLYCKKVNNSKKFEIKFYKMSSSSFVASQFSEYCQVLDYINQSVLNSTSDLSIKKPQRETKKGKQPESKVVRSWVPDVDSPAVPEPKVVQPKTVHPKATNVETRTKIKTNDRRSVSINKLKTNDFDTLWQQLKKMRDAGVDEVNVRISYSKKSTG